MPDWPSLSLYRCREDDCDVECIASRRVHCPVHPDARQMAHVEEYPHVPRDELTTVLGDVQDAVGDNNPTDAQGVYSRLRYVETQLGRLWAGKSPTDHGRAEVAEA